MDFQRYLGPYYFFVFILFGAFEILRPLATSNLPFHRRWSFHILLWMATGYLVALILRIGSVAYASSLPTLCPGFLFILIEDFCQWASHFSHHRFGWLWTWHATHHSDPDLDVSTGLRFHPFEQLLDQALILLLVHLLHPPASAVLILQFFSITHHFWVHSNIRNPQGLENILGMVLVTPGMHRSHHSQDIQHQKANFGVVLSIWDRLFKTFLVPLKNPAVGLQQISPLDTMRPLYALIQLPWEQRPRR